MRRVLIIGAGGHAQVVADILMRARDAGSPVTPLGYLDDNVHLHGQILLGLPVLGSIASLSSIEHDGVIVAIGANHVRKNVFESLRHHGETMVTAVHPSAIIAPDVNVGAGSVVCAGVIISPGTIIGENMILNTGCQADHHNWIDHHAHVAPRACLGGDVSVGAGSLIGIGAIVMPQRWVGTWSTVGAGALVHRNVPDDAVVVGVPARILRHNIKLDSQVLALIQAAA